MVSLVLTVLAVLYSGCLGSSTPAADAPATATVTELEGTWKPASNCVADGDGKSYSASTVVVAGLTYVKTMTMYGEGDTTCALPPVIQVSIAATLALPGTVTSSVGTVAKQIKATFTSVKFAVSTVAAPNMADACKGITFKGPDSGTGLGTPVEIGAKGTDCTAGGQGLSAMAGQNGTDSYMIYTLSGKTFTNDSVFSSPAASGQPSSCASASGCSTTSCSPTGMVTQAACVPYMIFDADLQNGNHEVLIKQ